MKWARTLTGKKLHAIPNWESKSTLPRQSICGKWSKFGWAISTLITDKCKHCLRRLERNSE